MPPGGPVSFTGVLLHLMIAGMRKFEISTQQLRLFLPDPAEAESALHYFAANREHLRPTDPVLPKDFLTQGYWEKRLAQSLEEFDRGQSVRLFFELLETPGKFIGVVNFTQIARGPFQACYLGYSVDREFQGKGMMYEALGAGIRYIFDEKHIHRVMANHLPENQRSAGVLKRLGFRVDGTSPEYLYIQGAWRTHVLTSLTNPNWTPREEDREMFE